MQISFLTVLEFCTIGSTFLLPAGVEARLGSSSNAGTTIDNDTPGTDRDLSMFPNQRLVPTPMPSATPVFLFDTPVEIINIQSRRSLYGADSNLISDEAGASVINRRDVTADERFQWTFRETECPTIDGEQEDGPCYIIANLVGRQLFAATFTGVWTAGVGTFFESSGIFSGTAWVLENGVCNDGTTLCYRFRNAFSNRRLFAQDGGAGQGTRGFGGSNPTNQEIFSDQFWEVRAVIPAPTPTAAPVSPTGQPTVEASDSPTVTPSDYPTGQPVVEVSDYPTVTPTPTGQQVVEASDFPTITASAI